VFGAVERLLPGYFALVMATGIVAIACHLQAIPVVPAALGAFNWIAWCVLTILTLARIILFPGPLMRDVGDHLRAPGFLTTVAGTSVLGAQTMAIEQAPAVAEPLWFLAALLWLLILYAFLVAMAVTDSKPPLPAALNGGWLLVTVATQSVVVLGGQLFVGAAAPPPALQLVLFALFLVGVMLYGMIMTLIFYRISFLPLGPEGFGPLYWIDTGGAAISTLAGATLLLRAADWPLLEAYTPFLRGATLSIWAAASFWLPFLVVMVTWRYAIRRDHFRYEPGLWGMVFPIGMYSAATFTLARAGGLPFLDPLSRAFAFASLGAWLIIAGVFLASLPPWARRPAQDEPARGDQEPRSH
jgi:tellurite resistance protein TehA-like permease